MTSTEIAAASKVMLGTTEAVAMYIGSTKIWELQTGPVGRLPQGYMELEYISSTSSGGLYIDLDILLYDVLNKNYDIAIKFKAKGAGLDNTTQGTIFGCQDNTGSPWPGTFIRIAGNGTDMQGRYIGGSGKDNTLGRVNNIIELTEKTSPNKNVYNYNNSGRTHTWGTSLFCIFNSQNKTNRIRYIEADLYYFKLFVEGTLVRDMVPCKNSNDVVGLYDLANNIFYTSPNGAAFVAGPEINSPYDAEIQYLESTGTQWIDTLIHPTTGYGFELYGGILSWDNNEFFGGGLRWNNGLGICTHSAGLYGIIIGTTEVCVITASPNVMHLFKVNTDGTVYIDNEYKGQSSTSIPDGDYTMNIFKHSTTSGAHPSKKIYYCKIFDNNNNLVFDGIPVRKNGIGYMFDKVSGLLFANAGTGNFTLGPDIT